ncbi:MAG: glycosyl hydrolase family 8 [Polyangiales bacterium]
MRAWTSSLVLSGALAAGCVDPAAPEDAAPAEAEADDVLGADDATAPVDADDSGGGAREVDARAPLDAVIDRTDASGALDVVDVTLDRAASEDAGDATGDVARDALGDVPRDAARDAPRAPGLARPFGAHLHTYAAGTITPSSPPAAQDAAVAALYDRWKAAYLRQRCGAGRYLVDTAGDTAGATVSEAHGWGMVIVVHMAGHDPDARRIFDGMVRYYQDHPSAIDPALMAWAQGADCRNVQGADAATDGDLDIAYALLLAERQWGNGGAVDYGALARRSMAAIARREVHPTARTLLVGDWATEARWRDGTRLSDFMFDHLRSFRAASGDARWDAVLARSYEVVSTLQQDFTSDGAGGRTGLLPDFAVGMNNAAPRPAPGGWLESSHDGHFYWNACRTPWRVAADHLLHGEPRAREAARRMNAWVRRATRDLPARVATGYRLDGGPIRASTEMAFVAPFAAAAAVDAANQRWLDALWAHMVDAPFTSARYYGNTIRLQVMLLVSRNAWAP